VDDVAVEDDDAHSTVHVAPVLKSSSSDAAVMAIPDSLFFSACEPLADTMRAMVVPCRVISISSPAST